MPHAKMEAAGKPGGVEKDNRLISQDMSAFSQDDNEVVSHTAAALDDTADEALLRRACAIEERMSAMLGGTPAPVSRRDTRSATPVHHTATQIKSDGHFDIPVSSSETGLAREGPFARKEDSLPEDPAFRTPLLTNTKGNLPLDGPVNVINFDDVYNASYDALCLEMSTPTPTASRASANRIRALIRSAKAKSPASWAQVAARNIDTSPDKLNKDSSNILLGHSDPIRDVKDCGGCETDNSDSDGGERGPGRSGKVCDDNDVVLQYFRMSDSARRCYNCGEIGHYSSQCMKPPGDKKNPCYLCGVLGHLAARCPGAMCSNCGARTHRASGCRRPLARLKCCLLCKERGHSRWTCPHQSSSNERARQRRRLMCLVCGKRGHACCATGALPGIKARIFCSNCGREGHAGSGCGKARQSSLMNMAIATSGRAPSRACFRCGKEGHISRECPSVGRRRGNRGGPHRGGDRWAHDSNRSATVARREPLGQRARQKRRRSHGGTGSNESRKRKRAALRNTNRAASGKRRRR
jgi:cellular nucleic acid-binding protein